MRAAANVIIPAKETDDWFTQLEPWRAWHERYRFTIDVAGHRDAPVSQALGRFYTPRQNGLAWTWAGERVWLNPPYSDIEPWVNKAHREMRHGGCTLVAALLPGHKTEQRFWHECIEPYRDTRAVDGVRVRTHFLRGRLTFGFPEAPDGSLSARARFNSVLVTWERVR